MKIPFQRATFSVSPLTRAWRIAFSLPASRGGSSNGWPSGSGPWGAEGSVPNDVNRARRISATPLQLTGDRAHQKTNAADTFFHLCKQSARGVHSHSSFSSGDRYLDVYVPGALFVVVVVSAQLSLLELEPSKQPTNDPPRTTSTTYTTSSPPANKSGTCFSTIQLNRQVIFYLKACCRASLT